jgi:hypothetical protein
VDNSRCRVYRIGNGRPILARKIAVKHSIFGNKVCGPRIAPRISEVRELLMVVAGALGVLVVFCLLLSIAQKPPAVGR